MMHWLELYINSLIDTREDIKKRWERYVEFGNPLEQYMAVQFADIGVVEEFKSDFILKVLDHIMVYESGRLVVKFLDGTEVECGKK